MIVAVIVACEVGFWVLLAAGLIARYLLRWRRASNVLLICVPLVDLVLLAATIIDLRGGATAHTAHGLAAAYLGFSVAFGHRTISRADRWVAHRVDGGPAPVKPPRTGRPHVRHEWSTWKRAVLAWAVACALLVGAIVMVGDASRTEEFESWLGWLTATLLVWLLSGPVWATIRWRNAPDAEGFAPTSTGRDTHATDGANAGRAATGRDTHATDGANAGRAATG